MHPFRTGGPRSQQRYASPVLLGYVFRVQSLCASWLSASFALLPTAWAIVNRISSGQLIPLRVEDALRKNHRTINHCTPRQRSLHPSNGLTQALGHGETSLKTWVGRCQARSCAATSYAATARVKKQGMTTESYTYTRLAVIRRRDCHADFDP